MQGFSQVKLDLYLFKDKLIESGTIPMKDEEPRLDYAVIKEEFGTLLVATSNNLERQWPSRYQNVDSARIIFFTRMRISINTYNALMWLLADIPPDPRRKYFVLSVAPLIRTLFEELTTMIFLLHDIPNLIVSFMMTDYTELTLERNHAEKYHGSNPKWDTYIAELNTRLDELAKSLQLTKDQISNPKKNIGRWPTPGKMTNILKKRYAHSSAISFMEYINSWMYRSLSGDSHLNFKGSLRRGVYFAPKEAKEKFGDNIYKEKLNEYLGEYKNEMSWAMFTLLLSIVSEIEAHFSFGLKDRAKYLWTIFENNSEMAKEFYTKRYKNLLL